MKAYFINDLHIDQWVKTQSQVGFSNTAQYKKLLEKWCLPADVLCIAGDVASSVNAIYATFSVLSQMYEHIFYIYGNHEMGLTQEDRNRGLTTYTKRDRIEQFLETATLNKRTKVDMLSILKGSSFHWQGLRVSGGTCYSDGVDSRDPSTLEERWRETKDAKEFELGWATSMAEISEYENGAVDRVTEAEPTTKIVMTHFAPIQLIKKSENLEKKGLDYGLSAFDGSSILQNLKSGTIWHFGHLHDKILEEVNIDGKTILAVNNSVGTKEKPPLHDIPKSEFLVNI